MPNGKKKKGHKMATHKRKKRLRKNRLTTSLLCRDECKEMKGVCRQSEEDATHPFEFLTSQEKT